MSFSICRALGFFGDERDHINGGILLYCALHLIKSSRNLCCRNSFKEGKQSNQFHMNPRKLHFSFLKKLFYTDSVKYELNLITNKASVANTLTNIKLIL